MGAMASEITSLTIVYSTVYTGADKGKHQSSASGEFTGDQWIPRTNGQENVSIWWHHYDKMSELGAHFINTPSIVIQIQWKLLTLTAFLSMLAPWIFAYASTAQISIRLMK